MNKEYIEQLKAECEYRKKQYDNQVAENTRLHIEYDKAFERLKAQQREIDKLKEENARLAAKLGQVLLSIDTVKEMNAMCSIDEQRKQAKIDVLNELKKKIHDTRLNDDTVEIIIEMIEELQK